MKESKCMRELYKTKERLSKKYIKMTPEERIAEGEKAMKWFAKKMKERNSTYEVKLANALDKCDEYVVAEKTKKYKKLPTKKHKESKTMEELYEIREEMSKKYINMTGEEIEKEAEKTMRKFAQDMKKIKNEENNEGESMEELYKIKEKVSKELIKMTPEERKRDAEKTMKWFAKRMKELEEQEKDEK